MDTVVALKANPLFREFTDTGLRIIAGVCQPRFFPKGAPIFVENMISDSMFFIGDGRVQLSTKSPGGGDVSLGEIGSGDYLGELSLLQEGQRMCTATAATQVTAFELRRSDFQKLLETKPQACLKLLMGVVARFGQKVLENRSGLRSLLDRA